MEHAVVGDLGPTQEQSRAGHVTWASQPEDVLAVHLHRQSEPDADLSVATASLTRFRHVSEEPDSHDSEEEEYSGFSSISESEQDGSRVDFETFTEDAHKGDAQRCAARALALEVPPSDQGLGVQCRASAAADASCREPSKGMIHSAPCTLGRKPR